MVHRASAEEIKRVCHAALASCSNAFAAHIHCNLALLNRPYEHLNCRTYVTEIICVRRGIVGIFGLYYNKSCVGAQAMKRSEQQQCIDAFNKRVGRPAPVPVQFPRPPTQQTPTTAGLAVALCFFTATTNAKPCCWCECKAMLTHAASPICRPTVLQH